jgi:hypothetical protein
MDTPLASNIINLFVAIGTIGAVIVALFGIWLNRRQARNDWLHAQQLATDDRQHQSQPIIVPKKEISHNTVTYSPPVPEEPNLYTSEHRINWSWPHEIRLNVRNMGSGPAFNLHCVLYGSEDTCQSQFVSWDDGPIEEKSSTDVELIHSSELRLFHNDSVDGKHPLYDKSLDSPSNPWIYRIACLTITYHDLFEKKHVSIFQYTLQHGWIHVATGEIPGKPPLDLKELNDQKKQGPKLSAPPVRTSQGK